MRTHPVYTAFEQRWQLPVYFQMRWKEIVGKLEDALAVTQIDPEFTTGGLELVLDVQSEALHCR